MIFVHTSDWHLGHQLHGASRDYEHEVFLAWLLDQLDLHHADALIISGDIYDHANPSSKSQRMLFQFLAELLRRRPPHFQTVIVGGNHDSAIRLDAPTPLLDAMRVHVVGGLPRKDGDIDLDRLCVPLYGPTGQVEAWVAAMPFLRLADLPGGFDESQVDPMVEGMRLRYQHLFDHLATKRQPGQALIATGHCYMVGSELSELSERRILGGNQHALPADLFPTDCAYVALGHLHKAQRVAHREEVRYCGAPIPLSFGERNYKHQVVLVQLDGESPAQHQALYVPRSVEIQRLGPLPLEQIEAELAALPQLQPSYPEHLRPFLEVVVGITHPEPGLPRRVKAALDGKIPRLLKMSVVHQGSAESLSEAVGRRTLSDLTPEEVFEKCYQRSYKGEVPENMRQAFASLLDQCAEVS